MNTEGITKQTVDDLRTLAASATASIDRLTDAVVALATAYAFSSEAMRRIVVDSDLPMLRDVVSARLRFAKRYAIVGKRSTMISTPLSLRLIAALGDFNEVLRFARSMRVKDAVLLARGVQVLSAWHDAVRDTPAKKRPQIGPLQLALLREARSPAGERSTFYESMSRSVIKSLMTNLPTPEDYLVVYKKTTGKPVRSLASDAAQSNVTTAEDTAANDTAVQTPATAAA